MYLPTSFAEADPRRLHALIEAHPLATMIAAGPDGLEVAHAPVLLWRDPAPLGSLRLHLAAANPLASAPAGTEITAIVRGPDAYVSPTWYEDPSRQVPTWNYAVVHVHGALVPLAPAELEQLLADMAARFEPREGAWTAADLRPGLLAAMLPGIRGFRIAIRRMEGKFKLSQNRSSSDRARVRAALCARGSDADRAVAGLMLSPSPEGLD